MINNIILVKTIVVMIMIAILQNIHLEIQLHWHINVSIVAIHLTNHIAICSSKTILRSVLFHVI